MTDKEEEELEELANDEVVDEEVVDEEFGIVKAKVTEGAVEDPLPVLLVAGPIENELLVAKYLLKSSVT